MSDTPDVLDALATFLPPEATSRSVLRAALDGLSAAGYVVVKAHGLSHGDELHPYRGDGRSHPRDVFVRRSVPENGGQQ